jgi:hypothetical protein
VTWHAPPGTKFVACALFSCDPEIGAIADHTSGSQVIVNFDTCVVLFKVAQVDEGVFRLDEQNTYTGFAERCTAATSSPRLFSALVVGCWAYDDYHLVAASDLVAVPPPTLRGLSNVPQGGPCTADGQACYDTTTDTFGVCVGTVCSARCRTAADCGAWGLRTGTSRPGDPCAWSCRDVPNTDLGACVRTD